MYQSKWIVNNRQRQILATWQLKSWNWHDDMISREDSIHNHCIALQYFFTKKLVWWAENHHSIINIISSFWIKSDETDPQKIIRCIVQRLERPLLTFHSYWKRYQFSIFAHHPNNFLGAPYSSKPISHSLVILTMNISVLIHIQQEWVSLEAKVQPCYLSGLGAATSNRMWSDNWTDFHGQG